MYGTHELIQPLKMCHFIILSFLNAVCYTYSTQFVSSLRFIFLNASVSFSPFDIQFLQCKLQLWQGILMTTIKRTEKKRYRRKWHTHTHIFKHVVQEYGDIGKVMPAFVTIPSYRRNKWICLRTNNMHIWTVMRVSDCVCV